MSVPSQRWIARISCTRLQRSSTCAAFIKETRMKYINAAELHKKSGVREQSFVTVTAASVLNPPHPLVLPKS
jgi:hypothetical protein